MVSDRVEGHCALRKLCRPRNPPQEVKKTQTYKSLNSLLFWLFLFQDNVFEMKKIAGIMCPLLGVILNPFIGPGGVKSCHI